MLATEKTRVEQLTDKRTIQTIKKVVRVLEQQREDLDRDLSSFIVSDDHVDYETGAVAPQTLNPLGLMAYYLVGNGKKEPYRLKMRTASFSNVSVLPWILKGQLVPDLIAILGSIFFVVGDVDK